MPAQECLELALLDGAGRVDVVAVGEHITQQVLELVGVVDLVRAVGIDEMLGLHVGGRGSVVGLTLDTFSDDERVRNALVR